MTLPLTARRVVLAARPSGIPQPEHFRLEDAPVPVPEPGQFLVRNEFLSVEPAMRGWVNATANYAAAVGLGEVMRSFAAGRVVASRHPLYQEGDAVMGMLGWQEYTVAKAAELSRIVDYPGVPLERYPGVAPHIVLTAWFGLTEVGAAKAGETLVVSAAAGAVFRAASLARARGL